MLTNNKSVKGPPLLRGAKNSNRWLMWMRGDKGGPENSQLPHTHTHRINRKS